MHRSPTRRWPRRWLAVASAVTVAAGLLALPASRIAAADPSDMVLDWNANAASLISSPPTGTPPGLGQGPPLGAIHLAMVHAAIHDAVMAIDPTHASYLGGVTAVAGASKDAAIAQAAHDVLLSFTTATTPAAVLSRLTGMLTTSLGEIPDGDPETNGRTVGSAAAAAIVGERTGDGRFASGLWDEGTGIGEWRRVPDANANIVAWFADVTPFVIESNDQFRTKGPLDIKSHRYAVEFDEAKAKGALTDSTRTTDEDSLASFVSANPLPYMNRGLREVAAARGLTTNEQALLFARSTMSGADALIGCWDDKRHWGFWRPTTAIREAAADGNKWTEPDADWLALYPVPGYTEHPSGYNCYTAATWHSARLFFHNDHWSFTLTSPGTAPLTNVTREYDRFTDVIDDTIDGRIFTGFHFRTSDVQGAELGESVAEWVDKHTFEALD